MPDIFGIDIAGLILDNLGDSVFVQTLVKANKQLDPTDSTKMITVETEYPHKGFIDAFEDKWVDGTTVKITDRKIVILGASLPAGIEPEPGDKILAEGKSFVIVRDGVKRDPAGATYECQSK